MAPCLRAQLAAEPPPTESSLHHGTVIPSVKIFQYGIRNPHIHLHCVAEMCSRCAAQECIVPAPPLVQHPAPAWPAQGLTLPARFSAHQLTSLPSLPGSLNVYLRLKGQTAIENPLWSSSGNKGQHWNQARVNINPPTSFQLIFEGIRGPGIEGDIAIDDVSIVEGECMKSDQPANNLRSGAVGTLAHIRLIPVTILMFVLSHQR
uniref:MAM domain-containing protein n=1 Tax=Meleagris gallopavo TaxID=9103 RepID=A0A803YQZ2_MELGA